MAKYKGKLSGKIVFLGAMRDVPAPDKPFFERYTDKDLKDLESLPLEGGDADMQARTERYVKRRRLNTLVLPFLTEEKVAGVVVPSRDSHRGGGTGHPV